MQVIVITGLSGSGKSVAIRQLEDSGFHCIDNLPLSFMVPVLTALRDRGQARVAVSVDIRTCRSAEEARRLYEELRRLGFDLKVIALTASSAVLVRRFSETRRRHPLTPVGRAPGSAADLQEAIEKERSLVSLEDGLVIDTSDLPPQTLKSWVRSAAETAPAEMTLAFESFAYKRGIPIAADFVFDVRSLPNPYYAPELRPLTGLDAPVADFLATREEVRTMVSDIENFIRKWLPSFEAQGRHYLTVCIGCTGGQHRSVFTAEELFRRFSRDPLRSVVRHRSLGIR